jgi:hypothetical protein
MSKIIGKLLEPFFLDGTFTNVGFAIFLAIDLSIMAGAIYVIVHFLRKYW